MNGRVDELRQQSEAAPFRGFQCWKAEEVGNIMHREAALPSRAVLLATHQPPVIRRVELAGSGRYGTEAVVTQDALLESVAGSADQSLIVPIFGAAGSGKSHLVLWLRARLEEQNAPNRRIIYLPRSETRLDRVIDLMLDGRTGGAFDEIRGAVGTATRAMDLDEAARRLRDELSVAVRKLDTSSADESQRQLREHLRDNLPDLLDDPVYVKRLVREGGPLRRIVEQAMAGASDEPAEVKPEDLDIQLTALELEELSRPAKTLLGDLQHPGLHEAAVSVLNDLRSQALQRILGVEPMQLVGVIRELRMRLFEENPDLELILMIEDFSLYEVIQYDLLEAMIELPRRDGKQIMCAMKTVMAVTDGFFARMLASSDALRTRISSIGHVYNLDVSYGSDSANGLDPEALADFAGRYLNAVRVGEEDLETSEPAVNDACGVCAHRSICHEAFGTAGPDGYGLYPFNAAALDRMVRTRQDRFNPRDLLKVVAATLTSHAQEFEDGRFPSASWARSFDPDQHGRPPVKTLSVRVRGQIDQTLKAEQRQVLLTFWGDAPDELVNLPVGIHEAFDIPLAGDVKVVAPPTPKLPDATPEQSEGIDAIGEALRAWLDGRRLDTENARIVRRVVRDAILAVVDPENSLLSQQFVSEVFDQDTDIAIENSAGSGRPAAGRFRVDFAPTNENALLFEGILKMQRHGSWDVDGGAQMMVALLTRVEAEALRLRAFIAERSESRRSDREAAVCMLALSGLIAGKGGTSDVRGLFAAAMSIAAPPASDAQPPLWRSLVEMTGQRRGVVREFVLQTAHVSKSTAEPSGVDGQQFSEVLRSLSASDWSLPTLTDDAPRQAELLRQVLESRLTPALDEAHDALSEWREEVVALVGDPDSATTRYKTWQAALDAAQADGFLVRARGFVDDGAPTQLGAMIKTVDGLLAQWPELDVGRRAAAVAKISWGRLGPARDHLAALEATLVLSLEKASTQQERSTETSPIASFERALDRLAAAAVLEVPE
jgi:hypothetical protein